MGESRTIPLEAGLSSDTSYGKVERDLSEVTRP